MQSTFAQDQQAQEIGRSGRDGHPPSGPQRHQFFPDHHRPDRGYLRPRHHPRRGLPQRPAADFARPGHHRVQRRFRHRDGERPQPRMRADPGADRRPAAGPRHHRRRQLRRPQLRAHPAARAGGGADRRGVLRVRLRRGGRRRQLHPRRGFRRLQSQLHAQFLSAPERQRRIPRPGAFPRLPVGDENVTTGETDKLAVAFGGTIFDGRGHITGFLEKTATAPVLQGDYDISACALTRARAPAAAPPPSLRAPGRTSKATRASDM